MDTRTFVLKARDALGMTAEQFSKKLNCAPRSIYRWESGVVTPNGNIILTIIQLCKESNVEVNTLLFCCFLL